MQHDAFIGRVQHEAQLGSRGDAERVTRIVLETLGERIDEPAAHHLAAQLPVEIGRHLLGRAYAPHMTREAFIARIAAHERTPDAVARRHAWVVLSTVAAAVSPGALERVHAQLPVGLDDLFRPVVSQRHATGGVRSHGFGCAMRKV